MAMAAPVKVKIGFIGLGAMGFPMASNLIKTSAKGSQLFIYDVSEASLQRFAEKHPDSTVICTSPAEVSKSTDILFTMLPEGTHVQSVYLDPATGVLHDGMTAQILVDCSTIDADTSLLVLDAVRSRHPGVPFFDAPVSGGTLGAEAGSITIMLGASEHDPLYPTLLSFLHRMGTNIVACGGPGMGLTAKFCNNYCSGLVALATAEAMNMGMRAGMDPRLLARVFASSTAQSTVCDKWNPVPGVVPAAPSSHGYQGGFKVQLMAKDFGLAMQAAEKVGATTLLGPAGLDTYRKAAEDPNCRDLDSRVVFRYIGGDEKWQDKLEDKLPHVSPPFSLRHLYGEIAAAEIAAAHKLLFNAGLQIRYEVAGPAYVDAALQAGSSDFARPMQELVTEACWGAVWSRPGLERKQRSLLNVAMLCALNRGPELGTKVIREVNDSKGKE